MTAPLIAALAALALALGLARPAQQDREHGAVRVRMSAAPVALSSTAAVIALLSMSSARLVLLGALAAIGALLVSRILTARHRATRAEHRAEQVLLACDAIAGDLSAGLPPGRALDRAAEHWAELGPVAVAARLDADVPRAFRDLARLPGAGQLGVVGAAWHVAHQSGTALGTSIARVTTLLREEAATRRLVAVELAAARVTARMICGLPAVVLLFAAGVGADPWHFLTATPVGLGCLVAGALLDLLGLVWMQRIADGVLRQ